MTVEIKKADQFAFVKMMVFGPSGGGKTYFIGTAQDDPRTSPILILDYEGGTTTLKGSGIDVVRIRSWDDYKQVYDFLVKGDHHYKSIGLDSVSETYLSALYQILDREARSRKIPDMPQIQDYGEAGTQVRRLLRAFRDLPLHVFATSLVKEDDDVREGRVKKPALSGQLGDDVPGIFEVVGYLSLATQNTTEGPVNVRALVLQNYPKIRAKARAPRGIVLPNEVIDPTVTSLLDLYGIPMPDGYVPAEQLTLPNLAGQGD